MNEKELKELLKKEGIENYLMNITEDSIEIDPEIRYTEENLQKIKKLLKAKTYEVLFNSHMEMISVIFYL